MIALRGIRKSFGGRVLFRDVDLRVGALDRVAVVGPNGSGKTTLLEMMVGLQDPDEGSVQVTRDAVVGYLPQETDALRGRAILEEVLGAAPAMNQAGHRLDVLTAELAATEQPGERDRLLAEFAELQERFETLGGYTAEAEVRRILAGLGFRDEDLGRPTDSLSGGWLMRIALAKLLVAAPDALLLDEPTNHLDVESVAWLERFLDAYRGAVVVISHDRDFMNAMATRVVEIDDGRLVAYPGDYESFVAQRAIRMEQRAAAARNQARKVEQTQAFIDRFRYKATKARQVQSRVKALERMERIEAPDSARRTMKIGFPRPPRSGLVVAELAGVDFAYGDRPVYRGLDLVIERGEKVALVGPNGAGKTTLLKLLAGVITPQRGHRSLGHNVSLGYFAQHQIEALRPQNRVIQELERALPAGSAIRPRDLLGRFLFSGDDVDKPVAVLSGGERTRLALARLLVSPLNFLCLDEPTNHLDIQSRDVLEDALTEYEGTMVLITHDRHLIRSVANRIVEVTPEGVRSFDGDYELYLYRKEREPVGAGPTPGTASHRAMGSTPGSGASRRGTAGDLAPSSRTAAAERERRRAAADERARIRRQRDGLRRVERDLDATHEELQRLEVLLADPAFYSAGEGVAEVVREYEEIRRRIERLESEWERLTDEPATST